MAAISYETIRLAVQKLRTIPSDDYGEVGEPFLHFPAGTRRDVINAWLDGVAYSIHLAPECLARGCCKARDAALDKAEYTANLEWRHADDFGDNPDP